MNGPRPNRRTGLAVTEPESPAAQAEAQPDRTPRYRTPHARWCGVARRPSIPIPDPLLKFIAGLRRRSRTWIKYRTVLQGFPRPYTRKPRGVRVAGLLGFFT